MGLGSKGKEQGESSDGYQKKWVPDIQCILHMYEVGVASIHVHVHVAHGPLS